jgi:Acyl-CoA carboxylase epsilon subunit
MTEQTTPRPGGPVLTVVAGHPTAEELAAVVVVLSARGGQAAGPERRAPARLSAWSARSRLMRSPATPGPGAWRASGQPR